MPPAIFVDYDGTITDLDTSDALVRGLAGEAVWAELDRRLMSGEATLAETMQREFAHVRLSRDEGFARYHSLVTIDPTFAPFLARARADGATVTVLSSGIGTLIRDAFARAGISGVEIAANDAVFAAAGWQMTFADPFSPNGLDKARRIRAASDRGIETIFIGDGRSDFDAALTADVRFAKRGRALERYLTERDVAFTPFTTFDEIDY